MEVRNYPGLPQPSQQPERVRQWHGTRHPLLGHLGVHSPKQRALAASWHPTPLAD